jgi:hypothetical protein
VNAKAKGTRAEHRAMKLLEARRAPLIERL